MQRCPKTAIDRHDHGSGYGITNLAQEADSESVRLRAWRAVLADQMAVCKFSDLEYRMVEIEERLGKRTGHTDQAR